MEKVWKQIFDDFTFASTSLKEKYTESGDKTRATSGAAYAMLGKAYMSVPQETGMRDFKLAKESFEAMMNRYQLDPDFANLFDEKLEFNSPESIFELDYDNVNRINHWQFDMGSRTVVATFGEGCYFAG